MKRVSLYLSLLLASLYASAQSPNKQQQDRFAGIDKIVDKVLHDWHAAGVAIAVVEKDKVIYAKGFGYRDYEKKLPVTPNTVFAIGSCSKAFTSGMLGILRQEGKLDFETPVRNYLPELVFNNDDLNAHVTLRDMMSHRTGLSRYDLSWYMFGATTRDSLLYRIRYMVPNEPLRYKWQYNNFMFMAQGQVAEKLTGKSWEENIKTRIFDSLGMYNSTTSLAGFRTQDAAIGYGVMKDSIPKKLPYKDLTAIAPAGSINSNVNDMAKWVIAWINGGKYNGRQVLPASYVSEAISSQMPMGGGLPEKSMPDIYGGAYGLGWMLMSYRGHYLVEHGGNIDGFSASTCFYPSDSIGIVILTNRDGAPVPGLLRNIISDRLFGEKYYAWSDTAMKRINDMKARQKDVKKDTVAVKVKGADVIRKDLRDYTGDYANNAFGKFEVVLERDSLFALIGDNKEYLRHECYDIFRSYTVYKETGIDTTEDANKVKFNIDINGEIASAEAELGVKDPVVFARTAKSVPVPKETLQKYIGVYLFGGMEATVHLKGEDQLMLDVPGQTDYTLVPVEKDKFALKGLSGFTIEFNINEKGEVTALTSIQPNGRYKAEKKK